MIAKDFRLKRQTIDHLLNKGNSLTSRLFITRYMGNGKDFSGFCVIISKKMSGKAVERNKLRRQIYEAIRTAGITKNPPHNINVVLIPKKIILKKSFAEIKEDLISLQSKITNQNGPKETK